MDPGTAWSACADVLLGMACVGCDRPGRSLCGACAGDLVDGPPFQTVPRPCPEGLPPVWASAEYAGVARAALLAHKEHGLLSLARPLGAALARAVIEVLASADGHLSEPVRLIAVPSRRRVIRERGHDPLRRITARADRVLRRTGVPAVRAPSLSVVRAVVDQSGLGAAERSENLRGAFTCRKGLAGCPSIIVDDIITTGSTASEASRAVTAGGGIVLGVAVVAATRRRSPP